MALARSPKHIPIQPHQGSRISAASTSTRDTVLSRNTDELVIALCGPIGSPLHAVADTLRDALVDEYAYKYCKIIRLSGFIETHRIVTQTSLPLLDEEKGIASNDAQMLKPRKTSPEFSRVEALINDGDALRFKFKPTFLAELAIQQIRVDREQFKNDSGQNTIEPRRVCHIIDSVKNNEELKLFRDVYGDMLYVVGVFAPLPQREAILRAKGMEQNEIYALIDRDSGEETSEGQTVRDTFPQSDFFLRADTPTASLLTSRVKRFLHLIFGSKVITPSQAESAMYAAAAAAGGSACLSRQVGAAITDESGRVVATGWNDVPKFLGGLYGDFGPGQEDSDQRCWNRGGKCYNDDEKDKFAEFLTSTLVDAEVINANAAEKVRVVLRNNTKLRNLLEFSRSVHAEMHAILNAGRISGSIVGGSLYVTTYPCHSCARHIVAAGIRTVYYIEPYRKSLATRLHEDSISEAESDETKVRLLPYEGVAPTRFLSLFRVPDDSRKSNGVLTRVPKMSSHSRTQQTVEAFHNLESLVVAALQSKLAGNSALEGKDGNSAVKPQL